MFGDELPEVQQYEREQQLSQMFGNIVDWVTALHSIKAKPFYVIGYNIKQKRCVVRKVKNNNEAYAYILKNKLTGYCFADNIHHFNNIEVDNGI